MKRGGRWGVTLVIAVALAGFVVSPALGGPGFLTQKKAGKVYLKKKAAKKAYLTRRAAEALLSKNQAQSTYQTIAAANASTAGEIVVSAHGSWGLASDGPPAPTVTLQDGYISYSDNGPAQYRLPFQTPVSIFGKPLRLIAFETCFNTSGAGVSVTSITLLRFSQSGADWASATGQPLARDATARTDSGCLRIPAAGTPALTATDALIARMAVSHSGGVGSIQLGRASLILAP